MEETVGDKKLVEQQGEGVAGGQWRPEEGVGGGFDPQRKIEREAGHTLEVHILRKRLNELSIDKNRVGPK
ncbi:hypothetical protein Ciccas_002197 [Cichlidogyrus casuarinus]|uniref:Uncharacterized protein n=1 Tax=Cichlidogyrus casuarinus TaxID=1844966 RepID=A0ABD2QHZ1_9PLAT